MADVERREDRLDRLIDRVDDLARDIDAVRRDVFAERGKRKSRRVAFWTPVLVALVAGLVGFYRTGGFTNLVDQVRGSANRAEQGVASVQNTTAKVDGPELARTFSVSDSDTLSLSDRELTTNLFYAAIGLQLNPEHRSSGSLDAGQDSSFEWDFEAGTDYKLVGICDEQCQNMDLRVVSSGTTIREDTLPDAVPIVDFTPETQGRYTVLVSMISCESDPCQWSVQGYAGRP